MTAKADSYDTAASEGAASVCRQRQNADGCDTAASEGAASVCCQRQTADGCDKEAHKGAAKPGVYFHKSLRNPNINYRSGWWAVTVQVARNKSILGAIVRDKVVLNTLGQAVEAYWKELPGKYPELEIFDFVVMPNHFHALLRIHFAETNQEHHLGFLMSRFKGGTSFIYGKMRRTGEIEDIGEKLWQRDYWDDLVSGEEEFKGWQKYILSNPANWSNDRYGACTAYTFGDTELLNHPRIAFVASQGFAAAELKPRKVWTAKADDYDKDNNSGEKVLISTFTSAQEREALQRALKKRKPLIAVFPAGIPAEGELMPEFVNAIHEGWVLAVSPQASGSSLNKKIATWCNEFVLKNAIEIWTGGISPNGMLAQMLAGLGKISKLAALAVMMLGASLVRAAEPIVQFDFDGPVVVGGKAVPVSMEEGRFVGGHSGRGYEFTDWACNYLPYDLTVSETNVVSGVFESPHIKCFSEKRWRGNDFRDAILASCWVKGEKGDKLEIVPVLSPRRGSAYTNEVPDEAVAETVEMSGEWLRIAGSYIADTRYGERRTMWMTVKSLNGKPFLLKKPQLDARQRKAGTPARTPPRSFTPGGRELQPMRNIVSLSKVDGHFPWQEGSFSAWMKLPEESNIPSELGSFLWWDRMEFSAQSINFGRGGPIFKGVLDRNDSSWQHIAITWSSTNAAVYRNGKLEIQRGRRASAEAPQDSNLSVRLGCDGHSGSVQCGWTIDDMCLWNGALTADEVKKLFDGTMVSDTSRWLAEEVSCTLYPRNQSQARAAFTVYAPEDADATLSLQLGNDPPITKKFSMRKGRNLTWLEFDARVYPIGKLPYTFTVTEKTGLLSKNVMRLEHKGEFEILPRFDRDAYKVFNWGGTAKIPLEYAKKAGMNAEHCSTSTSGEYLDLLQREGVNAALESNDRTLVYRTGFDVPVIMERLESSFGKYTGRANWSMTLAQTEQSNVRNLEKGKNMPRWCEFARKSLGHEPHFGICAFAFSLVWPKEFTMPADGIVDDNIEELRTFLWAEREGEPIMQFSRMVSETAHRLSPGNLVWAEPKVPYGVDMSAYWAYEYPLDRVISRLRRAYYQARSQGKGFIPTLGNGSCPALFGKVPGCEEKVHLAHTYDEMLIKTWACIGSMRAPAFSYFDLCGWSEGEKNFDKPQPKMMYAEKGVGERFGNEMRKNIYPAMSILADMDTCNNGAAAIVLSEMTSHTSGLGWSYGGYVFDVTSVLFDELPDCDILCDADIARGDASKYRYLFLPASTCVTTNIYNSLEAAAKGGTTILKDCFCKQTYTNARDFDDALPKKLGAFKFEKNDFTNSYANLRKIVKSMQRELSKDLSVYVEESDGDVKAWTRQSPSGAKAFVVLNNTRTKGPFSDYRDAPDYLPYGKACTATISMKVPEGTVLYDFLNSKRVKTEWKDGRTFVKLSLPPAGSAVLCAYEKPLEKLECAFVDGDIEGALKVRLLDSEGKTAKGRQYVSVKLTDTNTGEIRDESGDYLMKDGELSVPLYFPHGIPKPYLKAVVFERTSGFQCVVSTK